MFAEDVRDRLVAAGVGVFSNNIFISSSAVIPNGNGPYLTIIETGGTGNTRIQNKTQAATRRPTAQIALRGKSYQTTRAMAEAAYLALDGTFNTTINGTAYVSITARQEPTDLGVDAGNTRLVFNIDAEFNT